MPNLTILLDKAHQVPHGARMERLEQTPRHIGGRMTSTISGFCIVFDVFGSIFLAMENLFMPLDRALQVVLRTSNR